MGMDVGLLSLIVLGILLILLFAGTPVAFTLLILAGVGFFIIRGPTALSSLAMVTYTTVIKDFYLALSMFILMAAVLEVSGVGTTMYDMMHKWMAGVKGGLAMGTIAISTVIAAMSGSAATATITMGLLAYPEMEKRGYDKSMIIGCIPAGGILGPIIPPSVVMILVCAVSALSLGKLFMAGVFPGLLISFGWITYIGIRCWLNPSLGPPLPLEERVSWKEKFIALQGTLLPILLIFLVLGLIYLGVCTPTEAGGIGAFGAFVCTAINRNLTWPNLKRAIATSVRIICMLMWILIGAFSFSQLIGALGVQAYITELLIGLPVSRWVILGFMLALVYILGMFMDGNPIIVIFLPIFLPIIVELGFDTLWFGLIFTVDVLIGSITPPFGMILFYFKGLNQPGVTMMDIYRSIIPYAIIMTLAWIQVIIFPQIALWLPSTMF